MKIDLSRTLVPLFGIAVALLAIVVAILSIFIPDLFGLKQNNIEPEKEQKIEARFRTEGKIVDVNSGSGIVTIQQTGSPRQYKFDLSDSMDFKEAWTSKVLSANDLIKGKVVEVLSYQALEPEKISDSNNIAQVTIFSDVNTLPSNTNKLPKLEVKKERK